MTGQEVEIPGLTELCVRILNGDGSGRSPKGESLQQYLEKGGLPGRGVAETVWRTGSFCRLFFAEIKHLLFYLVPL